ncbi:hypothetical protein ACQ4PT_002943 [Festuca glaucescens]
MAIGIIVMNLLWSLVAVLMFVAVSAGDESALLAFKARVNGGDSLVSWNSSTAFCNWEGVTCSHRRPTRVVALRLDGRALVGALSPDLGNLTFLRTLNLSFNSLHGDIPASLGRLRRLQRIYLNDNFFSGTLPVNLSSCVSMTTMRLRNNKLGGRIPAELGQKLMSLEAISLSNNSFTGPIPASLANLSYLQTIDFSMNQLVGSIPPGLGRIQGMWRFDLYGNNLSGILPPSLYNMSSLESLKVGWNMLHGSILDGFGNKFPSLRILNLGNNKLTGAIPSSLPNISNLIDIYLQTNRLSGHVPSTLGRLGALQSLYLNDNNLEVNDSMGWEFITSLANCSQLRTLVLGGYSFGGQLPASITNLATLQQLSIADNRVFGSIPADIGNLVGLNRLQITNTFISGVIPESIVILFIWILRKLKPSKKTIVQDSSVEDHYERIPYHALLRGTNRFSDEILLGRGSYGAVFKCILANEERTLAVKVFNLGQSRYSKSFEAECEAMRRIRHRCLVKIITSCSSVNHQGQEFKALVFEFMPNGNLDGWLHPKFQEPSANNTLSLVQRLEIAVNIVDAVEYFHNYCQPLVIHYDLKPSNILLSDDMSARVGDFGISKIIQENTCEGMHNSYGSTDLRGSIGYVAPEYGEGSAVSPPGDIYSLGILFLEMFTGRSPTDDTFRDSLGLHKFAEDALPDRTLEIADPTICLHEEPHDNVTSRIQECLVSVFRLGISCSKQQPRDRTLTRDAAAEMHAIRDAYIAFFG